MLGIIYLTFHTSVCVLVATFTGKCYVNADYSAFDFNF